MNRKLITFCPGLLILGIVLDLGGGPNHDRFVKCSIAEPIITCDRRIGFRYWKNPGPFVQFSGIEGKWGQFLGFWDVLTKAAFSYIGTEIVAVRLGRIQYLRTSSSYPHHRLPPVKQRILDATYLKPLNVSTFVSLYFMLEAPSSSGFLYPLMTKAST